MFRWTQGISEARPPACRAGALPLSFVSVVWWSWVVSIHRLARFKRTLSQLSYTTVEPAPGLEPGSTGLQSQRPSCWARPAVLEPHDHAASSGGPPSSASTRRNRRVTASGIAVTADSSVGASVDAFARFSGTTSCSRLLRMECVSFQVVREEGVEPSSQGPKPCVLPLDDSRADGRWKGQWVPHPLLVGGSHACICQHLDPVEQ
jgi:hypothetical protein